MPLTPGTRLGVYEVVGPLGSGGMSEVYRARDTRLDRDVALKVLASWLTPEAEGLDRFRREARLLASLSHPGIARIHAFEEFEAVRPGDPPVRALVMELVEGPTLADRIDSGPLTAADAVSIAAQIADALDAAHDRNIIHRDLKPANIKLAAGVVKVLDFGLAKVLADDSSRLRTDAVSRQDASPTTQSGVILGTAAYMAPEQARGLPVDKRVDIWALGAVLYEMLTGRRLFQGDTMSDTIAAVLRQEIDWGQLPAHTSPGLKRVLRRCLERNPRGRFHDAADLRLALNDVTEEFDAAPEGSSKPWFGWKPVAGLVLVAAVVAALIGAVLRPRTVAAPEASIVQFTIEPPPQVTDVSYVAASPDGRFVVYEGQVDGEFRLFRRRIDTLDSAPVAGADGGRGPFISPDGAWIAFVRGGTIYRVPTSGGDAIPITAAQGGPGAVWSADGRIVFSRAWLGGLSAVPADGGTATVLTEPNQAAGEIGHWWPAVLPGGRGILFTIAMAGSGLNDARVALLDAATGSYRVLFPGAKAEWVPSGHLLYFHAGRFHAVRFDPATATVAGTPFPVLDDARELDPAGDWSQSITAASNGTIAYLAGAYVPPSRLTWIEMDGKATPLPFAARSFLSVKLSPDGRLAATSSLEAGRLVLRTFDLTREIEEAVKSDGMNWNPVWLPDGRLSFTSMRKGDFDVFVRDLGSSQEQAVLNGPEDSDPIAWLRDGRLVFQGSEPDGTYPLKLIDPRQPSQIVPVTERHVENGGSLSPDEHWLAYHSAASGRSLVYVRPMDLSRPSSALSGEHGEFPVFLRDGRSLALVRGRQLVVRSWRAQGTEFEVGPERSIAPLSFGSGWTFSAPYDVADGNRFLALVRTSEAQPPRVRVVLGWSSQLAQLDASAR